MRKIKLLCLLIFTCVGIVGLTKDNYLVQTGIAISTGPPAGHTGAPGEATCLSCHTVDPGPGQFTITAPQNYNPGQTYQIAVQHQSSDESRRRWGFQLTSLAGNTPAGTLSNISGNTQIVQGGSRTYIQHNFAGTFPNQGGGATWTFNWVAPAAGSGPVTFYAAGNQANNDGTSDGDRILTATATSQPSSPPAAPDSPIFDLDGDKKTDISIFRPSAGEWWYLRSSDDQNRAFQFGSGNDKIVPADYTGDGKTDIAFWRPSNGEWFVLRSEDSSFYSFPFGANGDIPVPADFDGDSKADPTVFRPSEATWFINRSSGGVTIQQFGANGDLPVVADYEGDGKADVAIFRVNVGEWWYLRSSDAGNRAFQFGSSSDKPVPGDYTGDGKTDVAFWRPSTGEWFILRSEDGSFYSFPFGAAGDKPAPGDYDGDGKMDAAVFRPSSSTWFVQRSTSGTLIATFGAAEDIPVPSAFVPL